MAGGGVTLLSVIRANHPLGLCEEAGMWRKPVLGLNMKLLIPSITDKFLVLIKYQ